MVWDGNSAFRAIVAGPKIEPPQHLNLEGAAEETLSFLGDLRGKLARANIAENSRKGWLSYPNGKRRWHSIRGYCDYSGIKDVSTSAALILTAEYARARELSGVVPPTIDLHRWTNGVFSTFYEIGFFEEVGLVKDVEELYRERGNVRTMRIVSGTNGDDLQRASKSILELTPFLLRGGRAITEEIVIEMNTAIGEGLANVTGWAYRIPHSYRYRHVNRWWLTAAADSENATLTISLYDQGATIPVTYNRPGLPAKIYEFFRSAIPGVQGVGDGTYIEGAMMFGASASGEAGRGQGLPQMKGLVDFCRGGQLTVVSRCGMCRYEPGKGTITDSFGTSVGGTLVEWKLALGVVDE